MTDPTMTSATHALVDSLRRTAAKDPELADQLRRLGRELGPRYDVPQRTREDVKRMTPDQVVAAKAAGELDRILGIDPEAPRR